MISLSTSMIIVTIFIKPLKPLKGCYNLPTEFMHAKEL